MIVKSTEIDFDKVKSVLSAPDTAVYITLPDTSDRVCIQRHTPEYAGYFPIDLYTISYLEDDGESYTVINEEHYPAGSYIYAQFALVERLAVDPVLTSRFAVPLSKLAIKR